MANIKFYYTSLEPNMSQDIPSQSIGGYIGNTKVYPEAILGSTVSLYDTSFILRNWINLSGETIVSIGSEIMEVFSINNSNVSIKRRGVNNVLNMHIDGDIVKGASLINVFNNVFNDNYKQYRCVTVKNEPDDPLISPSSISESNVYNMLIYLEQNSINIDTSLKIAIEKPKSDYLNSNSTSWSLSTLTDDSLIGIYNSELSGGIFKDAYLKITSGPNNGQNRIISSFDEDTGVFVFYDPFSVEFNSDLHNSSVSYIVEPSSSQRIKTGTLSPNTNTTYVSHWVTPTRNSPISLNIKGDTPDVSGVNEDDLMINDLFYIWIERTIKKGSDPFLDNNIIIGLNYSENP